MAAPPVGLAGRSAPPGRPVAPSLRSQPDLDIRTSDSTQRTTVVASVHTRQADREGRIAGWIQGKESDGGTFNWAQKRVDRLTADLAPEAFERALTLSDQWQLRADERRDRWR